MEEYLTTNELANRIKMAPGSIRNMIYHGIFKLNVHYVKPTPRKVLFMWSGIEAWLYGVEKPALNAPQTKKSSQDSLINI